MNYSNYRISLDIHDTSSQAMLDIKKDDTARKFMFNLTDGGRPYHIDTGCTAKFRAKKPDGTVLFNECTIENDVITYTLTSQTSASVGIVECEVTLYGPDSHQITSPRFSLLVEDNLYSDSEIESTNEFTALTEAMSALAGYGKVDANVSKTGTTATITVTDKEGTVHTASVEDGIDGIGISDVAKTSTSGKVDTYTITLTDGTTKTFTVTNGNDGNNGNDGIDGKDGISVTDAAINDSGHLIITLSNSTLIDSGVSRGEDGVSVTGVTIDDNGHLIVTLSSGNSIDAGMSKGDPGDSGVYIGSTPPSDPSVKVWIDTSGESGDVEMTSNKVTSVSASSTDKQYPSAKAVKTYVDTAIGDIEPVLDNIIAIQESLIGGGA